MTSSDSQNFQGWIDWPSAKTLNIKKNIFICEKCMKCYWFNLCVLGIWILKVIIMKDFKKKSYEDISFMQRGKRSNKSKMVENHWMTMGTQNETLCNIKFLTYLILRMMTYHYLRYWHLNKCPYLCCYLLQSFNHYAF